MSLSVNNVATFWSVNGGLIIPPFAKSIGRMLCNKLIIPVTNRVINNKGNNTYSNLIYARITIRNLILFFEHLSAIYLDENSCRGSSAWLECQFEW